MLGDMKVGLPLKCNLLIKLKTVVWFCANFLKIFSTCGREERVIERQKK